MTLAPAREASLCGVYIHTFLLVARLWIYYLTIRDVGYNLPRHGAVLCISIGLGLAKKLSLP
jgi:hypothetical protein